MTTPAVSARHTLDLGLYEPRRDRSRTWGMGEFRGWGGSSHPDVTVSAEGFSTESQYEADPRVEVPGKTTRAFRPGRRSGRVSGRSSWGWRGSSGSRWATPTARWPGGWRSSWRATALSPTQPYRPAPYDATPAKRGRGWYAGDMHVHAEQSAYGDATMREAFDYAFGPLSQGRAGLDFITLSDYVSGGSWGEVGRHQARYPGKLVVRSAEVITYRGHLNNHNTAKVVDYREGPIYERGAGGVAAPGARAPAGGRHVRRHQARGRLHPDQPPHDLPVVGARCSSSPAAAAPWDYWTGRDGLRPHRRDRDRHRAVREKTSGQGPNPFTATAIDFYERALGTGNRVAAVGVSDSHNAGRAQQPRHPGADRRGDDGGAGRGAVGARHRVRRRGRAHLREGDGQRRARRAHGGAAARLPGRPGDLRRHGAGGLRRVHRAGHRRVRADAAW